MPKTLAIVGAGRVGRALGRRLREQGWRIGAVVTRSAATARAALRAIGGGTPHAHLSPEVFDADVILIAAPDRAVADVASRLAGVGAAPRGHPTRGRHRALPLRGKTVLHTSGSLSHAVLTPLAKRGASIAAMHPMQTFGARAIPRLEGVVFGIDGQPRAVRAAQRIARSLGGIPVRINAASKPAYHAAGGFAAQHVLAVLEAGTRILMRCGFTRKQATRALLNLARQTLDNVEQHGPRAAWTGPVARGDFGTVAKHIAVLRKFPREFRESYAALTRLAVLELARDPGTVLRQLKRILKKDWKMENRKGKRVTTSPPQ